jgi:hypothetical protein
LTWLRLAVLALAVAVVGLPINSLFAFGLLAVAALVAFTGSPKTDLRRWLAAVALALLALMQHALLPPPRIEEGHNVFLVDGAGGVLEKALPPAAFRIMDQQFQATYPPERRCVPGADFCWRPGGIPDRPFAFAADNFLLEKGDYSRLVTGIDFRSAVWLRLGFVNDKSLYIDGKGKDEVRRQHDDRRMWLPFHRHHILLPYFLMYRFPPDFVGGRLCWRGELLWEGPGEQFEHVDNKDWGCRTLQPEDTRRRIFALSIKPDAGLAMSFTAPWKARVLLLLHRATAMIAIFGILIAVMAWRPRRAMLPLVLIASALVVVVIGDAPLLGGFRPVIGDGQTYSGFARQMLLDLLAGNVGAALQGGEKVFFFTPGMRYFRALEYIFFGDTALGYLAVLLILPLVVYALAARLMGIDWALVVTLGFVILPLGAAIGINYWHYVRWAVLGFGDPLAATAFLAALVLFAGFVPVSAEATPSRAFWGAALMAIAVVIRPNLVPGVGVILAGVGLSLLLRRHFGTLLALCAGFLPVFLPLAHNWYFGGVLVPFIIDTTIPLNYRTPSSVYLSALGELARLEWAGDNVRRAASHVVTWFAGPAASWVAVPFHVAATLILIRVCCSRRFAPMLRLMAGAAIALSLPALVYEVVLRYHLVVWLLMSIVVAAWLQHEGLAMLERYSPDWRRRIERGFAATGIPRGVAWLRQAADLGAEAPSSKAIGEATALQRP